VKAFGGFVGWLRKRPEYDGLAMDIEPNVRSLREVVRDMQRSGACVDAQLMLVRAAQEYAPEGVPCDSWTSLAEWATT
jgi:hypothetical protein